MAAVTFSHPHFFYYLQSRDELRPDEEAIVHDVPLSPYDRAKGLQVMRVHVPKENKYYYFKVYYDDKLGKYTVDNTALEPVVDMTGVKYMVFLVKANGGSRLVKIDSDEAMRDYIIKYMDKLESHGNIPRFQGDWRNFPLDDLLKMALDASREYVGVLIPAESIEEIRYIITGNNLQVYGYEY